MKLFQGWVMSAGLVLSATAANAQGLAPYDIARTPYPPPYSAVSDVAGPYAGMPPEAPVARFGPMLLPPTEVYAVVRESGFSPLGIPRQRGLVYVISVIDRGGDDGRLVIDARTGRIIRFMPAWRMGDNFNGGLTEPYAPPGYGPPGSPPPGAIQGEPRSQPPAPHFASRTPPVPLPKPPPPHAGEIKPQAAKPAPAPAPSQQSAAVQARPADAPPAAAVPAPVEAAPAPPIQPTQAMPKVQGLD
jgi:hypothetical protein